MPQIITREHVENFRRARLSRDPRQIEPWLHDDVDWLVTGPVDLLYFCGQRRGKAEVVDCLVRQHPAVLDVLNVETTALLVDRDRAASFTRLTAVQRSTGRTISFRQAQFLLFRDYKIVEYRGIIDSFDAAEQMIGHPIEVAASPREFDNGNLVAI